MLLGTLFDIDSKKERLEELNLILAESQTWSDSNRSETLSREQSSVASTIGVVERVSSLLEDADDLLVLAVEEKEHEILDEIESMLNIVQQDLKPLEFKTMFSHELDPLNAYVDIQFGAGGTESQDWANMLLRMYLLWGEKNNFDCRITALSEGEIAGIRNATIQVIGDYAFGWLRTETGIHRLVRNSPFDSNHRRHTSFASLYVYAEIDDDIEVEIKPDEVRTDTYRASGAGGQHVNQTDSAVRLTHIPTNTVVQCQSERSQHRNREQAWRQLRAKLYHLALQKEIEAKQALESAKPNIGFGSQIRSYVLDQSRVKDHRTGHERTDPTRVLDGDIGSFMEESLIKGV